MKNNTGFSCIELAPGANTQVVRAAADPDPPEGFIDNTVYRYRMINGEKVLIGTMDPYPEGWDEIQKRPTVTGRRIEEDESMSRVVWDTVWPQVQELLAAGKTAKEIAVELEIDLKSLTSKIYREEKAAKKQIKKPEIAINPEFEAAVQEAEEITEKQVKAAFKRAAAVINPDFEEAFKQTPDPEPEKVGRQDPVQEQEEPAGDSVHEGVPPVNMPIGMELPKYTPDDNDLTEEDLISSAEPEQKKIKGTAAAAEPKFDLARIKVRMIELVMKESYITEYPDNITLALIGAIKDLQLPEVG